MFEVVINIQWKNTLLCSQIIKRLTLLQCCLSPVCVTEQHWNNTNPVCGSECVSHLRQYVKVALSTCQHIHTQLRRMQFYLLCFRPCAPVMTVCACVCLVIFRHTKLPKRIIPSCACAAALKVVGGCLGGAGDLWVVLRRRPRARGFRRLDLAKQSMRVLEVSHLQHDVFAFAGARINRRVHAPEPGIDSWIRALADRCTKHRTTKLQKNANVRHFWLDILLLFWDVMCACANPIASEWVKIRY